MPSYIYLKGVTRIRFNKIRFGIIIIPIPFI